MSSFAAMTSRLRWSAIPTAWSIVKVGMSLARAGATCDGAIGACVDAAAAGGVAGVAGPGFAGCAAAGAAARRTTAAPTRMRAGSNIGAPPAEPALEELVERGEEHHREERGRDEP